MSAYDIYPQVQSRNIISTNRVAATPDVLIQQTGRMEGNREFFQLLSNLKQSTKKRKGGNGNLGVRVDSKQMSSQIKKQSQIYLHKRSTSVTKNGSKKNLPNTQVLNAVAAMDQTAIQANQNNLPQLPTKPGIVQDNYANRSYGKHPPTAVYNAKPTNSPASFSKSPKIPPNPSQDSSIIQNTNFKRSSSQARNVRNSSVSNATAGSTKTNYSHINTTRSSQQNSQKQPSRSKSRVSGNQNNLSRKLEEAQKRLTNMSNDQSHIFQRRGTPLLNNHASTAYQSPDIRKSKQRGSQSSRSPNTTHIEALQVASQDLRGNIPSGEMSVTTRSGNASRLDIKTFDNSPLHPSMIQRPRKINEHQNQAYQVEGQPYPHYREQQQNVMPAPPAPQAAYNDEPSSIVQLQRRAPPVLGGGTTFQSSTMTGGGLSMLVGANLSTYFIGSENQSLEDMHTLFVAFYQRKRALLEKIQKRSKKNRTKENSLVKVKDLSSTGIMIQDAEVTQQSVLRPHIPGDGSSSSSAQISQALRVETKKDEIMTAIVDIESQEDLD